MSTSGSGKRFVPSKLRHVHEVPSQALNWRLLLAVLTIGLLGASRGMDEGVISGSIGTHAFEHAFNVKKKSNKESNIVAMIQLLSTLGALVGYACSDRFGRVAAGRLSCMPIIIGSALWMGSANRIGLLYVGRMVTGVGVGISSVCSPVFLVETVSRSPSFSYAQAKVQCRILTFPSPLCISICTCVGPSSNPWSLHISIQCLDLSRCHAGIRCQSWSLEDTKQAQQHRLADRAHLAHDMASDAIHWHLFHP